MPAKGFRAAYCQRGHELAGDNVYVDHARRGRHCKACLRLAAARYRESHPDRCKGSRDKYHARYPGVGAEATRKSRALKYGLSVSEYRKLRERLATGPCEICGTIGPVVLDHDAGTGEFRGLLCRFCNQGIGSLMHNPTSLRNAAMYLERAYNASRQRETAALHGGGVGSETRGEEDANGNVGRAA